MAEDFCLSQNCFTFFIVGILRINVDRIKKSTVYLHVCLCVHMNEYVYEPIQAKNSNLIVLMCVVFYRSAAPPPTAEKAKMDSEVRFLDIVNVYTGCTCNLRS